MALIDTLRQPRHSANPTDVVIVSRQDETGATGRLMSMPLHRGLTKCGIRSIYVKPELAQEPLSKSDCVLFHYEDIAAVAVIRAALKSGLTATIGCFGSDIYSFDKYVSVHDFVTFYLVPTDMHRMVLSSQVSKPVYVFPEAVDDAVGKSTDIGFSERKTNPGRRVCWFGYAASFDKGMASLIPVIKKAVVEGRIDCFDAILDEDRFENTYKVNTRLYNHLQFETIANEYDYVILSHFGLDLSINSMIKSPNKAISAIISGLIPLATDTPSYGQLFREVGLERFLFSSPFELSTLLNRLDPDEDGRFLRRCSC
jgi:hypothetical protein